MAEIKSFVRDKLTVRVFENSDEMGCEAALFTSGLIRTLLEEKETVNMIFAAAPSQDTLLKYLVKDNSVDWSRINAYHMDEYIGLSAQASQSFASYLKSHIFDLVPFKSVNLLKGNAEDPEAECERYSRLLEENPADIVCLGIGENAHIAFNDPWVADFEDPKLVKTVPLDPVCRMQQVHDGCFASLNDVPEKALSLTIPALVNARHMVCSVPKKSKKDAVRRTVYDEITAEVPASIMRRHKSAVMFCDAESGEDIL